MFSPDLHVLIRTLFGWQGNQHSDDPGLEGCISCRILWASCPTFWAMIKDLTVADKATLLHLGSRNAAGVPRRSSSETLGGWKSAINTKLKPEIKRQVRLCDRFSLLNACSCGSTGDGQAPVKALHLPSG